MKTCETCRYWTNASCIGAPDSEWRFCEMAEFYMRPNPPDVKAKALSNDVHSYSGRLTTHKKFGCNQHQLK